MHSRKPHSLCELSLSRVLSVKVFEKIVHSIFVYGGERVVKVT